MSESKLVSSRLIPKNVFANMKTEGASDFIDFKIPKSLRIQTQCFDSATYEVEDPIKYIDEVKNCTSHYLERTRVNEELRNRQYH